MGRAALTRDFRPNPELEAPSLIRTDSDIIQESQTATPDYLRGGFRLRRGRADDSRGLERCSKQGLSAQETLNVGKVRDRLTGDMTDSELDDYLAEWRKWCFWRDEPIGPEDVSCASIEHRYISPQCWWPPEPRQEPPVEWIGLSVEKAVQALPERYRAVLRMEFLGVAVLHGRRRRVFRETGDTPETISNRKRRSLHMAKWDYEETLERARIMVRNVLGSTWNER